MNEMVLNIVIQQLNEDYLITQLYGQNNWDGFTFKNSIKILQPRNKSK